MSVEDYLSNKQMVTQLHSMARRYDSEFLRTVADKMDIMIEENRNEQRATRVETMGRRSST